MNDLLHQPVLTPVGVDMQHRLAHLMRENAVLRLECGTLHDTLLRLLRHMRFVAPKDKTFVWVDVSGDRVRSVAFQMDVKHAQVVLRNEETVIVTRSKNDQHWQ